jgi:hypothetical protein
MLRRTSKKNASDARVRQLCGHTTELIRAFQARGCSAAGES